MNTSASRPGRLVWLAVTIAAVLLYLPGAQAYYRALLANPFSGSTFVFPWKDAGGLALAFGQLGLTPSQYAWLSVGRQVVVALGYLIIASLIAVRASDRGALLIAALLVTAGTVSATNTAALSHLGAGWWLLGTILNVVSSSSQFTLAYVFPDGRFVPRWFRWAWLSLVAGNAAITFAPGSALNAWLSRWPWLQAVGIVFLALEVLSLVASPVYRYRRDATAIQRQQMKWVLLALIAQPVIWPLGAFGIPALFPATTQSLAPALAYNLARQTLQDFGSLLIPLTIGLAILRYRLFEIDVLIRRTLIYAVLTGLLALAYLGSVVALQNVFSALTGQAQSTLVTVLSTLAIAALFVPLRRRVQAFIDRRFFRRKYDSAKTLSAFSATLRDETNLDQLSAHLTGVVDETMHPAHVSLWLRLGALSGRTESRP